MSSTTLSHRLLATAAAALAAACVIVSPAHAAAGWFSGTSQYQSGPQCYGGSQTGFGANTDNSVSYLTDTQAGYPAVGDRYLMRILSGAVGFSCPWGISDVDTEILLPEGTGLSIDLASQDPDDKVRCFYEGSNGQVTEVTDKTWTAPWDSTLKGRWCDSTTIPRMGTYGYHLGTRLLSQGTMFWVDVPVVSFKALNGMGGAANTTKMGAAVSSGVNTFVNPTQWVTVFDRPAAVRYPADATTAITDTTVKTRAVLDAWYRKGSVYVDLGTGTSGDYQVSAGPIAIDGDWVTYTVTQDWGQLTPGTDHHWRLRFVDEKGATTVGEPKTFRTTGTAPAPGGGTPPPAPKPGGGGTGGGTTPPGGGGGGTTPGGTGGGTGGTGGTGGATGGGGTGGSTTPGGGSTPVTTIPAAPSPAAPAAANATATRIALAPGTRLGALTTPAGAKLSVTCAAACRVSARLQVDAATARRLGLGRQARAVASGSARATKAGGVTVRLKAAKALAKALKRAKAVTATLSVTVDGGPPQTARVTLRR